MRRDHQHLTSIRAVNVNGPTGLALQVKKERRAIVLVVEFLNFSCLQDRTTKTTPLQHGKDRGGVMIVPVIPAKAIVAAAVTGEYMTQAL